MSLVRVNPSSPAQSDETVITFWRVGWSLPQQPAAWDPGAWMGAELPAADLRAMLPAAANTTCIGYSNGTFGALLDVYATPIEPGQSLGTITIEHNWGPATRVAPWAAPGGALDLAIDYQAPLALRTGEAIYSSWTIGIAHRVTRSFVWWETTLWDLGRALGGDELWLDTISGSPIVHAVLSDAPSAFHTRAPDSALSSNATWSAFRRFHFSVAGAQVAGAIARANAKFNLSMGADPADWLLVHTNVELESTSGAKGGHSLRGAAIDWVASAPPAAAAVPVGPRGSESPFPVATVAELHAALEAGHSAIVVHSALRLPAPLVLTSPNLHLSGSSPQASLSLDPYFLSSVVTVRGTENVTLEGLGLFFTGERAWSSALPAALAIVDSFSVRLHRLRVEGGVSFVGGGNVSLGWSRISNRGGAQGGTCLYVMGCGNSTALSPCNLTLHDNAVEECRMVPGGSPYGASAQGVLLGAQDGEAHRPLANGGCVVGAVVRNNDISGVDEMGIRVANNFPCACANNQVVYNRVSNWGQGSRAAGSDCADSGCLYVYGHWYSPGNNFSFNACNTTNASWGSNGAYLDDAASGNTFVGNYFFGGTAGVGVKLNGGQFNTVHSNVVVRGGALGFANCRGVRPPLDYIYTCNNNNTGVRWMKILQSHSYLQPPWSLAFPWYQGFCSNLTAGPHEAPCAPRGAPAGYQCASLTRGNDVRNFAGVALQRAGVPFAVPTAAGFPYLNWSSACPTYAVSQEFNHVEAESQFFYPEEGGVFVDPGGGDYTIRADAQLFRDMPNFARIDWRCIGVGGGCMADV